MAKSGFSAAFAKARAELGAGKNFTYNGKSYSTNLAGEKATAAPATSKRPMAKPAPRPAAGTPAPTKRPPVSSTGGPSRTNALNSVQKDAARGMGRAGPAAPPAATTSAFAPGKSPRPQGRPPTSANAPGTSAKPVARPVNAFLNSVSNPGAANSRTKAAETKVKMDAAKKPGQDRAAAAMEAGRKRAEAMRTKK